jgi:predicted ATP-dependent serine protease
VLNCSRAFSCGVCDAAVRRCSRSLADSLGELRLKGKAEPVSAWEVVTAREARSRLEVEAERGLTALVGREREMAALWDCFEKARAGQGQMMVIVGEPGIGKSRLVESNNDHAISQIAA